MAEKKMPSQELLEKAQKCKTPEQLIELAKTEGIELTKEQAEAYLAQDVELTAEDGKAVAGGICYGRRHTRKDERGYTRKDW